MIEELKVPSNLEAENEIIAILISGRNEEVKSDIFLQLSANDFHYADTQVIYAICYQLWQNKKPVDLVTVSEVLDKRQAHIEFSSVVDIAKNYISDARYKTMLDILQSNAKGREAIKIAQTMIDEACKNPHDAVDNALQAINKIDSGRLIELEWIGDIAEDVREHLQEVRKHGEHNTGAETPYRKLNKFLQGFQKGDTTVIAARPGIGKSAFLSELVLHNAIKEKKKVALFSLEMSKQQLVMRMYANLCKVSIYDLKDAKKNIDTSAAFEKLKQAQLYVEDNVYNLENIIRACKVQHKRKGLDLICVDYLGLVKTKARNKDRRLDIEHISREFKLLALELKIPIVLLSQMNRAVEYQQRAPVLADLRESGAIEQDASQVIFLHANNDKAKAAEYRADIDRFLEVYIAKNRNGATGAVFMKFEADKMRFVEVNENGRMLRLEDMEEVQLKYDPFAAPDEFMKRTEKDDMF